ncbi:hypothetical protein Zmor_014580 [Zophobas morio]|uniref:Cytochrome P450 n=1 Tax=Zophobas morio TaxID=2755281 RepID=A0AA38MGZ0_9CUCU|nr:hypothetical protein Zmor_014580 [Zophobas morio]
MVPAWIFLAASLLLMKYLWSRRWVYYYTWKIAGPVSFPIIGSTHLLLREGYDGFLKTFTSVCKTQPAVFKLWLGGHLLIVTSQPEDIEIFLTKYLKKGTFYEFGKELMGDSLINLPVEQWKVNRKIINQSFNSKILNSFVPSFVKYANRLVEDLSKLCDGKSTDILPEVFKCTLDAAIENLTDVDASLIKGQEKFIANIIRMEDLLMFRMYRFWLHMNWVWKRTAEGKENSKLSKETTEFIKQIINRKKMELQKNTYNDDIKRKQFLNHLFNISDETSLSEHAITDETKTMLIASSETTAITISMVLLVLAIRSDVQNKIYKELTTLLNGKDRDVTLEDLNKMLYLECTIKETMRFFPTVPAYVRTVDENVKLDSYTVPAGSTFLIAAVHMNKREDIWSDPLTFNPDRFLSQNDTLRHKCAYVPFSYGPRNCIGLNYAMLSMKAILATLLKNYMFYPVGYKSFEDIEFSYSVVAKVRNGYNIRLTHVDKQ